MINEIDMVQELNKLLSKYPAWKKVTAVMVNLYVNIFAKRKESLHNIKAWSLGKYLAFRIIMNAYINLHVGFYPLLWVMHSRTMNKK